MGVMRFLVHPPERITDDVIQRIYMAGLDRVPWYCRVHRTADGFAMERMVSDSGNLYVPWMVPGFGEVTLGTGSLMERERPYHLLVELARGKVNQVRSQLAEWQSIGLTPPKPLMDKLHEAVEQFALAATSQHEPATSAPHAERAIEAALHAAALLATTFTEQALAVRYRQAAKLSTQLGANLGSLVLDESTGKLVRASFNTAALGMNWREIESSQGKLDWSTTDAQIAWCQNHHLQIYGGPLLRLDSLGLPDWLYLWEGDFDSILSFLSDHVERTVTRYRGKVNLWLCASRINVGSVLSLREVDKQRMAVRAIELTRKLLA